MKETACPGHTAGMSCVGQDEPSSEAEFITTVLGCFSGTVRGTRELLEDTGARASSHTPR